MYNNCQSEKYDKNYNNNKYFEILQNQKITNNYCNDNYKLNNNKIKNMEKLKKNKSSSIDKLNIDNIDNNIYSYKNEQANYNNTYNEEDLDIELDSVSTKIPINDFYIDSNEKKNIFENSEMKYKYKIINTNNKNGCKTCSPLIRKKKSKIKRNISYDNLHNHALGIESKNKEKRNISNINITNNNMELNTFKEINENLNNKTEYECYRNINNKLKEKNTFDDEINIIKFENNSGGSETKEFYNDYDEVKNIKGINKLNYYDEIKNNYEIKNITNTKDIINLFNNIKNDNSL